MKTYDLSIGQKFRLKSMPGMVLQVVKQEGCEGCFYDDKKIIDGCRKKPCRCSIERFDHTSVIFKRIK